jgi:hypothetical protein
MSLMGADQLVHWGIPVALVIGGAYLWISVESNG